MAKLTDTATTTNENEYYYYDVITEDNRLLNFTDKEEDAITLGWEENKVLKTETERSDKNPFTYLKGYAPKKTTEEYFNEFKSNLRTSVKDEFEKVAQEKGFSGSVECTSYAMASNSQRKTWALIYLAWRDKADAWYDDWIDNKLKLQAKVPNLEEVLAEMPQIDWDAKLTEV